MRRNWRYLSQLRDFTLTNNLFLACRKRFKLLCSGWWLVFILPLAVGHAIDNLPRLLVVHWDISFLRGGGIPLAQAVAAEIGKNHKVDILDLLMIVQMLQQAAEGSGLNFGVVR